MNHGYDGEALGAMTRRRFLKALGVSAGLAATPQLVWGTQRDERDLLFVVNNGDASVSVIDTGSDEVLKTFPVGTTAAFPANKQFERGDVLVTGLHSDKEPTVHFVDLQKGEVLKVIETGSSQNYTELTPDGHFAIVAARFADSFLKIGADPRLPDFGQVVATLDHFENSRPCDITLSPEGKWAFDPDRGTDTFSVIDLVRFEVKATVPVPPLVAEPPIEPFMSTASPDGKLVFVENIEGDGTVSVFDVGDVENPEEIKRFTQDDGLGLRPLTDEFTLDGEFNFIINRNSSDMSVVRVAELEITGNIPLVEGGNPVAGDFSIDGRKFYVPVQNRDVVAIVDVEKQRMIGTIDVGPQPMGAIASRTTVPSVAGVALGSLPPIPAAKHRCSLPCCGSA